MYIIEEKDRTRLKDIVKKSKGNREKIISLSTTMAIRIGKIDKAIARAIAADELATASPAK